MIQNRQRGAVLVVSLVMLVVLTLFVLSSTRISTGNLKIVGNLQAKQNAEAVAQSGIEQVISSLGSFWPTSTNAVTVNGVSCVVGTPCQSGTTGMTLTLGSRTCLRATTAQGYTAVGGSSPEDTFWNVPVTVTDTITNTSRTVTQGVRIRLPPLNCPT